MALDGHQENAGKVWEQSRKKRNHVPSDASFREAAIRIRGFLGQSVCSIFPTPHRTHGERNALTPRSAVLRERGQHFAHMQILGGRGEHKCHHRAPIKITTTIQSDEEVVCCLTTRRSVHRFMDSHDGKMLWRSPLCVQLIARVCSQICLESAPCVEEWRHMSTTWPHKDTETRQSCRAVACNINTRISYGRQAVAWAMSMVAQAQAQAERKLCLENDPDG